MDKPLPGTEKMMSTMMDILGAVSVGLLAALALWLWLGTGETLALVSSITGLAGCL